MNRDKFLTEDEQAYLDKMCSEVHNRDTALIALAMATGARASELLNVTKADLNEQNKSVYIRALKGGRDREIPLRDSVFTLLSTWIPFGISYQRLDQIWAKYRPNNKKFHALRHTFAINLYKKTRDIKLVQLALGHKSIATTMIYTDFVYSQEELRRLIL